MSIASFIRRNRGALTTSGLLALLALLALSGALASEGVRVGSAVPPSPPVWALILAALLFRLARRREGDGARAWTWAALLVATLAGGLALDAWRQSTRDRDGALVARVTSPSDPAAETRVVGLTLRDLAAPRRLAERVGRRGDVALVADGFVTLPRSGGQRFELSCAGTCALAIDGHVVARASGEQAPSRVDVALDAGPHALRLELTQPGPRARLALDWDGPARVDWRPLGALVGPAPVDPARLRAEARLTVARTAAAAILTTLAWLALACLVPRLIAVAWAAGRAAGRAWWADALHRRALLAGGLAVVFLVLLRAWAAPHALPGGYLHAWSSEYMMQTVSAADLRSEPLLSLLYLHIQPPLFDALRALLVARHAELDGAALLQAVDADLYRCWGLASGAAVALVCAWLARLRGSVAGTLGAALFALHPAVIFYATFLDTTFVSAAGVLWLTYELWRAGAGRGSAARLLAALIALLLTRSIVQWPFVFVAAASLALVGAERRLAARALLPFALATALFVGKQYALFGLTITSSFGPDSFCKGLSEFCLGTTPVAVPRLPPPGAASVLRRTEKLNGEYNYNQLAFLRRSFAQLAEYRALLAATPPPRLVGLMARNASIWLRPSSRHSAHALVDRLPWRAAFDFLWSGAALVALLVLSAAGWAWGARGSPAELRRGLGLALPVAYVAAVSIAFESGENMRYKFFVEPVLWVFVCAQVASGLARLRARAGGGRA